MCNFKHKYKVSSTRLMGRSCDIERHLQEDTSIDDISTILPHDTDGYCLFHSLDMTWKKTFDMNEKLIEMLGMISITIPAEYQEKDWTFPPDWIYHFTECYFTSKIVLKHIDFNRQFDISYSIFEESVTIWNSSFKNGIKGREAEFKETLKIEECTKVEATDVGTKNEALQAILKGRSFYGGNEIRECSPIKDMVFHNTRFNSVVIRGIEVVGSTVFTGSTAQGFVIHNARFLQATHFDDMIVGNNSLAPVINFQIKKSFFHDFKLIDTVLNCTAQFSDVQFKFLEIDSLATSSVASSDKFMQSSVNFLNIEILEGGEAVFKGIPENKLFANGVSFINVTVNGSMEFENVDFFKFATKGKDELRRLKKLGKVRFGDGCLGVYRRQSKIMTSEAGASPQKLITHLAGIFVDFFTSYNDVRLEFEILEKSKDKISYFYFTDEDITDTKFFDLLKETEKNLLRLFQGEDISKRKISEELSLIEENTHEINELKIDIEAFIKKLYLGVKSETLSSEDIETTFNSVAFSPNSEVEHKNIVTLIINIMDNKIKTIINGSVTQGPGSIIGPGTIVNNHGNAPLFSERPEFDLLKNLLGELEDATTENKQWQQNFTNALREMYELEKAEKNKDEIGSKKSVTKISAFFNKAKEVKDWAGILLLPAEIAAKGPVMIELIKTLFS